MGAHRQNKGYQKQNEFTSQQNWAQHSGLGQV